MWTGSRQTRADHVLTPSSVLGGEPPGADEAEGANIFLGDSDKWGGEEEGENKISFLLVYFWPCWVCCCKVFPPGCGKRGLRSSCGAPVSLCGSFSGCGAPALGSRAQQLRRMGLVAPLQAGSSGTGVQACVPCIGKRTPNRWTSGGVPT